MAVWSFADEQSKTQFVEFAVTVPGNFTLAERETRENSDYYEARCENLLGYE